MYVDVQVLVHANASSRYASLHRPRPQSSLRLADPEEELKPMPKDHDCEALKLWSFSGAVEPQHALALTLCTHRSKPLLEPPKSIAPKTRPGEPTRDSRISCVSVPKDHTSNAYDCRFVL